VGALVKSRSRRFGQRQQKLLSKVAGALIKSSKSFHQKQQEQWHWKKGR